MYAARSEHVTSEVELSVAVTVAVASFVAVAIAVAVAVRVCSSGAAPSPQPLPVIALPTARAIRPSVQRRLPRSCRELSFLSLYFCLYLA